MYSRFDVGDKISMGAQRRVAYRNFSDRRYSVWVLDCAFRNKDPTPQVGIGPNPRDTAGMGDSVDSAGVITPFSIA